LLLNIDFKGLAASKTTEGQQPADGKKNKDRYKKSR